MPKYEYLTYTDMHSYYAEVLRNMACCNYKPDLIIAPMRGGVDMGVKFSEYFDVPVIALQWQTRDGGERDTGRLREILQENQGARILVVDDICDSGKTLEGINVVVDRFTDVAGDAIVDYAVAIHNDDCDFEPTWWGRTIYRNQDTQWFVFPWEAWWKQ